MERPIILKAHEVRGILDGRQSQLRRVIKKQYPDAVSVSRILHDRINPEIEGEWNFWAGKPQRPLGPSVPCPFGWNGDRIWVKETWWSGWPQAGRRMVSIDVLYRADNDFKRAMGDGWLGPVTMPRWASRILLEIVSVRVERLQDISEGDAKAEGALPYYCAASKLDSYGPQHAICGCNHKAGFCRTWHEVHSVESWDANPWVWVVEFKRVDAA